MINIDPNNLKPFYDFLDTWQEALILDIFNLSKEIDVSEGQADQIYYLRGRSRWSQELEDRIIKAYKETGIVIVTLTGEEEQRLIELGY